MNTITILKEMLALHNDLLHGIASYTSNEGLRSYIAALSSAIAQCELLENIRAWATSGVPEHVGQEEQCDGYEIALGDARRILSPDKEEV